MKRITCLLLSFALILCLSGCRDEVKERDFELYYAKNDFAYSVVCGTLTPRDFSNAIVWFLPVTIYVYPIDQFDKNEKITYYDCHVWVSVSQLWDLDGKWVCNDEEVHIPLAKNGYGIGSAILYFEGASPTIQEFYATPESASGTMIAEV